MTPVEYRGNKDVGLNPIVTGTKRDFKPVLRYSGFIGNLHQSFPGLSNPISPAGDRDNKESVFQFTVALIGRKVGKLGMVLAGKRVTVTAEGRKSLAK
ncbi:MAG: hypothetical protein IJG60_00310 [Thermoguttaceae bacterium]|nr:hypothetical protein [Thermoguttaceae bacterium]